MTTFISYIEFADLEAVERFEVFDAQPEREDGRLGELPDGTPVWPVFTDDIENNVVWVTATVAE